MTKIAFIDVETTGLDPSRHEVWEVAYILIQDGTAETQTREILLPVDLEHADPKALRIGRFHGRHGSGASTIKGRPGQWPADEAVARATMLHDLEGAILIGNNVSFDARFLEAFLGSTPWHYHVVDVKALVAGKLGLIPPWDTEDLLRRAGLPTEKKHEALADCEQARALYNFALSHDQVQRRADGSVGAIVSHDGFEALGVGAGRGPVAEDRHRFTDVRHPLACDRCGAAEADPIHIQ